MDGSVAASSALAREASKVEKAVAGAARAHERQLKERDESIARLRQEVIQLKNQLQKATAPKALSTNSIEKRLRALEDNKVSTLALDTTKKNWQDDYDFLCSQQHELCSSNQVLCSAAIDLVKRVGELEQRFEKKDNTNATVSDSGDSSQPDSSYHSSHHQPTFTGRKDTSSMLAPTTKSLKALLSTPILPVTTTTTAPASGAQAGRSARERHDEETVRLLKRQIVPNSGEKELTAQQDNQAATKKRHVEGGQLS
ncbi:hypothetical protein BDZ90DRAFT_269027 [Jaminaea rosea]|uniref:Uncharacterized protein n=1 Tax=Jaminaea rosea TaxID=1569628 RepID=A0A316UI31_9BASI|nr:hypothetical protein BDZ90DRAFT_269027 [Jaminaea rosea]PWN24564.1 hypothetical protein BDZ90DRAFT_269027 [Jaminaea rosea]